MKTSARITALLGAASLLFLFTAAVRPQFISDISTIPDELVPRNGSVTEYWPNHKVRSERTYRDGQIEEAVYYTAEGTVVFEVSGTRKK